MGIIRTALRKLLDHELGVTGVELERVSDRLEVLQLRFNLLQNRVGTRMARAEQAEAHHPTDASILRDMRNRGASNSAVFDDDLFPRH